MAIDGGSFNPFQKSIGTIGFLFLHLMTADDWEWLDIHNVRTVAFNRIAAMIVAGELFGFYDVHVTESRGGRDEENYYRNKPRYLWPANERDHREFTESDRAIRDKFTNSAEAESLSEDALALQKLLYGLSFLDVVILGTIIAALVSYGMLNGAQQEQAEQVDEEQLRDIGPENAELLTAIMMMWGLSLVEAGRLLETLDENSTPADVIAEVKAIKADRYRLAAGRGI